MKLNRIIYFAFLLSGAAGLIYEIVWGRLLLFIFGSGTNSITAVISAFLGGLAIGSLISGKFAEKLNPKSLIKSYILLELGTALLSSLTLIFLPQVRNIYALFSDGSEVSAELMIIKFILSTAVLILPAILMGATLPILVRFVKLSNNQLAQSTSTLYAINTLGAVLGVLLSAYVLIELFGLSKTLIFAALLNLAAALFGYLVLNKLKKVRETKRSKVVISAFPKSAYIPIFAFFLSGLVSIAYEILWTRILTPTVGTYIYAFANILTLYLLGIGIGSLLYKYYQKIIKSKTFAFGLLELGIGICALGSVILLSNQVVLSPNLTLLLVLLPATVLMGLTFPALINIIENEKGAESRLVGVSYFANTVGCIIGGLLASFFLIPRIGSTQSLIILSIINFLIALWFFYDGAKKNIQAKLALIITVLLILFTGWIFQNKRFSLYASVNQWRINWAKQNNFDFIFREDEVASVFGYSDRKAGKQDLIIDGVPTTNKVVETRLMAHLPIAIQAKPENMLIIAFGMGSTYRSSLMYPFLKVDAVEIVPSVPNLFKLFYPDARKVLSNPHGRIIINDGRNYVSLTNKRYDIVVIDPPPPFNVAGTTVLYSKEFYRDISRKLTTNGLVSQWIFFDSYEDDMGMAIKTFAESFPYVYAIRSKDGVGGLFLEGSSSPINASPVKTLTKNKMVADDLKSVLTINEEIINQPDFLEIVGNRKSLLQKYKDFPDITDDTPRTEYFFLRHKLNHNSRFLKGNDAVKYIDNLRKDYQLNK